MKTIRLLLASVLFFCLTQAVQAELAAHGGPHPVNHFPLWFQDSTGLALQLGLDGDGATGFGVFDQVDPDNPFSVQIGFGSEAFYSLASVEMTYDMPGDPGGGRAVVEFGLEAAFAADKAIDGDQFVFGRIRARVDIPMAGDYKIIHPYGVDIHRNAPAGKRGVNDTVDIGGIIPDYERTLTGRIGPFLRWTDPDYPVVVPGVGRFVGDPQQDHTVTGSPFGTNYVRIEGPEGCNIGGTGIDFIETDQFSLTGKIFEGPTPTPVIFERATYNRTTAGWVDVFVTAPATASLEFQGEGNVPVTPMTGDGTGRFFGHLVVSDPVSFPRFVSVTANNPPDNSAAVMVRELVDAVNITKAEYYLSNNTLTIKATSSDAAIPPTLTAEGFGDLTNGILIQQGVLVPPAKITVNSSAGGSDSCMVDIVADPPDVLTVTEALYVPGKGGWRVTGTETPAIAGTVITIRYGSLAGPIIGTTQVAADGSWLYTQRSSPIIASPGDKITLTSSNGAILTGVDIIVNKMKI